MRLEFTYTAEDLAEMVNASPSSVSGDGSHSSGAMRSLFGWVLFIGLAIMLFLLMQPKTTSTPPPQPPPSLAQEPFVKRIIVPLVPWILIFGFIWFFVFRRLRAMTPANVWKRNPGFQQPKWMELNREDVALGDPLAATRYQWTAFSGWVETANLLLLRQAGHDPTAFLIIPKRAVTPEQLDELRTLLAEHIVEPTGGFPVTAAPSDNRT